MKPYVGMKEKARPKIFEAASPTKETHPQFEVIYGSFKSRQDAERYIKAKDQGVACSEGQVLSIKQNDGHVRIRDWKEFKRLVREKKPQSITFILEQNPLSPNHELSSLRIIMMHDHRYYMFFDFAKNNILKETGITLRPDKKGILNLDEDEVRDILRKEFEKDKIEVFSFWTT